MHGVQIRSRRFKTTPSRRPYRLPFETIQVPSSDPSEESLHVDPVRSYVPEHVSHQKSNFSDMDSDKRDDVSLIHILKHGVFSIKSQPNVSIPGPSTANHPSGVPFVSLHSTSSSFQDDILSLNVAQHSSGNVSQGLDNVDQGSTPHMLKRISS